MKKKSPIRSISWEMDCELQDLQKTLNLKTFTETTRLVAPAIKNFKADITVMFSDPKKKKK